MSKFLLSMEPGSFVLSERFSQDPIENYFGKQRARGGRNENPTVQQALHNAAALRVQKSMALNPIRGNCRGKRLAYSDEVKMTDPEINTPLPKRKRKCKVASK